MQTIGVFGCRKNCRTWQYGGVSGDIHLLVTAGWRFQAIVVLLSSFSPSCEPCKRWSSEILKQLNSWVMTEAASSHLRLGKTFYQNLRHPSLSLRSSQTHSKTFTCSMITHSVHSIVTRTISLSQQFYSFSHCSSYTVEMHRPGK